MIQPLNPLEVFMKRGLFLGLVLVCASMVFAQGNGPTCVRGYHTFNPGQEWDIITAAMNHCECTIHLEAGAYRMPSSIEVHFQGVTIEGSGKDVTVLQFGDTTNIIANGIIAWGCDLSHPTWNARETTIKDLTIIGPSAIHTQTTYDPASILWHYSVPRSSYNWNASFWKSPTNNTAGSNGIYLLSGWNKVRNVKIKSWWQGIRFGNSAEMAAANCLVEKTNILSCFHGIYINGTANDQITIKECWIGHNGGNGIKIGIDNWGGVGPGIIKIQNNLITNCGLAGAWIRCAYSILIEGNYFDGNCWRYGDNGPENSTARAEILFGYNSGDTAFVVNPTVRDNYFDLTIPTSPTCEAFYDSSCGDYQIPIKCTVINAGNVAQYKKQRIKGWATSVHESQNTWRDFNSSGVPILKNSQNSEYAKTWPDFNLKDLTKTYLKPN
jgi:hypothetical protein